MGLLYAAILAGVVIGFLFLYSYLNKKFPGQEEEEIGEETPSLTPQKIAAITACINSYYESLNFQDDESVEFIVRSIKRR